MTLHSFLFLHPPPIEGRGSSLCSPGRPPLPCGIQAIVSTWFNMPLNKNSLTFPLLGLPRFQWLRIRAMTCKVPTLMLQFYTLSIAVALALQTLSYCPPFWIITPALLLYFYQMQCCPSSSLIAAGCGAMAGFSLFSPATFPNHVCSRNPGPWPHCFLPGQRQQNAHPLPRHQLPPMSFTVPD